MSYLLDSALDGSQIQTELTQGSVTIHKLLVAMSTKGVAFKYVWCVYSQVECNRRIQKSHIFSVLQYLPLKSLYKLSTIIINGSNSANRATSRGGAYSAACYSKLVYTSS